MVITGKMVMTSLDNQERMLDLLQLENMLVLRIYVSKDSQKIQPILLYLAL